MINYNCCYNFYVCTTSIFVLISVVMGVSFYVLKLYVKVIIFFIMLNEKLSLF